MKKILSIFLCCLTLFSVLAVTASAEDVATYAVGLDEDKITFVPSPVSGLPDVPHYANGGSVIVVNDAGDVHLILYNNIVDLTMVFADGQLLLDLPGTYYFDMRHYTLSTVDGVQQWSLYTNTRVQYYKILNANSFLYSDTDIVNDSGEVVFHAAPSVTIYQRLVEMVQALVVPKTMRTLMILTVVGVSCLAFLISLPLFGKVLYRFLA